jgi:hypothetical protein
VALEPFEPVAELVLLAVPPASRQNLNSQARLEDKQASLPQVFAPSPLQLAKRAVWLAALP